MNGPGEITAALLKVLELLFISFMIIMTLSSYLANREMSFITSQVSMMAKEMVDQADKDGGFSEGEYQRIQNKFLDEKIKTWVKPSDVEIVYISPAMGTKRTYLGQPVTIRLKVNARKLGHGWIKKEIEVQSSSVNRGNYGDGYAIKS